MAKKQLVKGMPTSLHFLLQMCEHYVLAKQVRMPVLKVQEGGRAVRLLEKVFSDIAGREDVHTPDGKLYTLNFIDDFSDKSWVYNLKRKNNTPKYFREWKALVEQETGHKVNIFCTNNGGEYSSNEFENYL